VAIDLGGAGSQARAARESQNGTLSERFLSRAIAIAPSAAVEARSWREALAEAAIRTLETPPYGLVARWAEGC
jgi:hypothetical protein